MSTDSAEPTATSRMLRNPVRLDRQPPILIGFDETVLVELNTETSLRGWPKGIRLRTVTLDNDTFDVIVGCAGQESFRTRLGGNGRDRFLGRHTREITNSNPYFFLRSCGTTTTQLAVL